VKAPLVKVNTLADLKLVKREIEEQTKVQAEAAAQQAARHKRLQAEKKPLYQCRWSRSAPAGYAQGAIEKGATSGTALAAKAG